MKVVRRGCARLALTYGHYLSLSTEELLKALGIFYRQNINFTMRTRLANERGQDQE